MDKLSPREREVAEGLHKGISRKELAHQLGISAGTLQNYVNSSFKKLGIHGEKQLVLFVERERNRTVAS